MYSPFEEYVDEIDVLAEFSIYSLLFHSSGSSAGSSWLRTSTGSSIKLSLSDYVGFHVSMSALDDDESVIQDGYWKSALM